MMERGLKKNISRRSCSSQPHIGMAKSWWNGILFIYEECRDQVIISF